ncbi:putative disease resistance protein RGA3 [Chenopodium quinoa]|uniref:putative disease resistance protein RGA3 n=1 Tax=Chenopodium quinoa TaxID=63459 RepID=UPI000B76F5CC|nr:putative disease resistance protein RGA3 [Chenopodium quinoa]
MESMDRSDITSMRKQSLLPTGKNEYLKSKTNAQPKLKGTNKIFLPQSKILNVHPQFIEVEPSQFRSVVQRLTGRSTGNIEEETDQVMPEIFKKSKAYEDMFYCVRTFKKLECPGDVSQECLDCLVYCSLFPKDYEIDRDTLLQLWMAEGLIEEEPMEEIAASYVKVLCEHGGYISLLREDDGTGKIWYRVNSIEIPEKFLKTSRISPPRLISEDPTSVLAVAETDCIHVTLQRLLPKDFQALGRYSKIRTILLLGKNKSNVKSVPYDFFMSLQHLHALDLSRTKVSELPSSLGNARCLRYLDLSETLIKRLPETIEFLQNLQTLKLQNCPCLVALPKSTKRLTCLRHLDLGTLRPMPSMPAGMGALSCLRTLSEFIVGKEHGCRITELRNMNDLGGKFCLSKLENVAFPKEAKEANLGYKKRLMYLELRWTDDEHQDWIGAEYKVMKCLQPHTNLQDLRILCYGGSTFPCWIGHPSFGNLTKITIFKCASCQVLPSLEIRDQFNAEFRKME